MAITCTTSPVPTPCLDPEPSEPLATPALIGPPDPAAARRREQAEAEARLALLADEGGMSHAEATSREGAVPTATTIYPRDKLLKEWIAAKEQTKHEKPVEHDPIGQALPTLPLTIGMGVAHGAAGILKHVAEHVGVDAVLHGVEHWRHERAVEKREHEESRDVQPAPRPHVGIRG